MQHKSYSLNSGKLKFDLESGPGKKAGFSVSAGVCVRTTIPTTKMKSNTRLSHYMNPIPMFPPIIDAHTHVGSFGSWAQVSCTGDQLLGEMDQFGVEKAIVFSTDNQLAKEAVARFPKRLVGYVWPNPYEAGFTEASSSRLAQLGISRDQTTPSFSRFPSNRCSC